MKSSERFRDNVSTDKQLTHDNLIRIGAKRLATVAGEAAFVEARALLLDCMGYSDYGQLLTKRHQKVNEEQWRKYQSYLQQRQSGCPVAYILGWREFYGRRFKTTSVALIPRPETELLVELALYYALPSSVTRVVDLGTGCGAIGISIALERPEAMVLLTDFDSDTLTLAKNNAKEHRAMNVNFSQGDWFSAVNTTTPFDMIVSNPPYIAEGDSHWRQGDLRFEPKLALLGGCDGLVAMRDVILKAPSYLRRGGVLIVENGYDQAAAVAELFVRAGFCGIRQERDLGGIDRVTLGLIP